MVRKVNGAWEVGDGQGVGFTARPYTDGYRTRHHLNHNALSSRKQGGSLRQKRETG